MNSLTIPNSPRFSVLQLLGLPQDTDFVALGKLHGSQGLKPSYPQYLEYYTAWADSYRNYLLSASTNSDSSF